MFYFKVNQYLIITEINLSVYPELKAKLISQKDYDKLRKYHTLIFYPSLQEILSLTQIREMV